MFFKILANGFFNTFFIPFHQKIREFTGSRMYPLTITGIVECMKVLKDKKLKYLTAKEK